MNPTALQIFLMVDLFIMGVLAAEAVRYALAHYKPHQHGEPAHHDTAVIPSNIQQQLVTEATADYQKALQQASATLQHDLASTSEQIGRQTKRLATEIVTEELERYQTELMKLREQAMTAMSEVGGAVEKQRAEMQAQVEKEVQAEKDRLVKQIDVRLADAVTSFLMETLQHNVDLGAQNAYLMSMLEEHKEDFKKEILA